MMIQKVKIIISMFIKIKEKKKRFCVFELIFISKFGVIYNVSVPVVFF